MRTEPETTATPKILLRHDAGGVATLTLNRPQAYNTLSEAMLAALQTELDRIAGDPAVRVVVIAGNGRAFSAGHDLKEMRTRPDRAYYEHLFRRCSRLMQSILQLPQPVIARVHGLATAAGCQLVATSDLAVAAQSARFATSGIGVGLFCMTPAVALSRNIGRKAAFEMLFTGEFVAADEARALGLVNRVAPDETLDEAVEELVATILAKSSAALAAGKRMFYRQLEMSLENAYDLAAHEMACNMMLEDAGEGIDAFIAKRDPKWRHR